MLGGTKQGMQPAGIIAVVVSVLIGVGVLGYVGVQLWGTSMSLNTFYESVREDGGDIFVPFDPNAGAPVAEDTGGGVLTF